MKKIMLMILFSLILVMVVSCGDVNENERVGTKPAASSESDQDVIGEVSVSPTSTPIPDGSVVSKLAGVDPYQLYDESLLVATPEQKQKLLAIRDNLYFKQWPEAYTREIKQIMGLLPEDTPYLTLADVENLIREFEEEGKFNTFEKTIYEARDRLNEIAGAPDVDGGSGHTIIWYSLDPEHKSCIQLHDVLGIRYRNAEGEWSLLCTMPWAEQ